MKTAKLLFFLICTLCILPTFTYADDITNIDLTLYIDYNGSGSTGVLKSPPMVPSVSYEGSALHIEGTHDDYTLSLTDSNGVTVFETFVPSSTSVVYLPTTLSGTYELRLSTSSYYLLGYIFI